MTVTIISCQFEVTIIGNSISSGCEENTSFRRLMPLFLYIRVGCLFTNSTSSSFEKKPKLLSFIFEIVFSPFRLLLGIYKQHEAFKY